MDGTDDGNKERKADQEESESGRIDNNAVKFTQLDPNASSTCD